MDVNFEYYKIFYYVAKYNNFTRAARVLGNSQPNVTRAMNCLEQQLHCTLLVRTNRGVFLTTEGEKLYTHVAAAMEQLFTAEEELAECVGLSHGSIAIGASETALNLFLLDKLKEFHNTYPGIRLNIYNHSTPQAIRALKKQNIFVYCADLGGAPLEKTDLSGPVALVLGSEGAGPGALVRKLCDAAVTLDMAGGKTGVDSYNVSVAAGILMYNIMQRRK